MFKQLGAGTDDAATFSKNLVGLAGDLVAFHNVAGGTPEVLNDIQSAFRGEFDPIQKYIPILNAAVVEQVALAESGKESAKQLTMLDKTLATQTLIVRGMGDAYGAAAREIDSAASQQRIFDARIQESAATLGQVFLPVQQAFYKGLNELLTIVAPYGENIMRSLIGGIADGIVYLLPVLAELRAVFVELLKPGSPPKLLRELTDWGKAAMQEYLRGWTLADFDALQEVGGMMERVIRSFASSGDIAETDLVSRVFGSQRAITQAIREFRELGQVSEGTFGAIADAAGPAGTEVAELVRRYFDLQRASKGVVDAQNELNAVTDKYTRALNPVNAQLDAVRRKQREISENQELEELGKTIADPSADADERQLARLRAEEIQLERQANAIEGERDVAVDAAQAKIDAAQKEEAAQKQKYDIAQQALEQQTKTNSLIAEETALRQRLIDEGLAEQKRVLAELEAEQRKAAAEAERVADANLRWRLASTDTAGQLAIMQENLKDVAVGSAEYFDILTQIIGLEERIKKERESAAGGLFTPLAEAMTEAGDLAEKWPEIVKIEEALAKFFATMKGEETVVSEVTWGQGILDFFTEAGRLAEEAKPLIQAVIDLILGKNVEGLDEGGDPFADNWWLAGFIPGLKGLILTVQQLINGDWAALWQRFKYYVDTVLNLGSGDDGTTFFFYTWLKDTVIPLFESLASGAWADAWTSFETTVKGTWDSIVAYINERIAQVVAAIDEVKKLWELLPDLTPGTPSRPPTPPGGWPKGELPPLEYNSFPGGIAPLSPMLAGAASTSTVGDTITYFIEQHIAANSDFGGARQGAEAGIREALLQRRLSGA